MNTQRNYIDKNHAVSLRYCYETHPIDAYYQDSDKGSSRNVTVCSCKFDNDTGREYDRAHKPTCEIVHVCKSLAIPSKGVTALYIGSTERGEYEHVYVYYGSDMYRKDARYFPVHKALEPMQKLIELRHIARLAVNSQSSVDSEQMSANTYAIHSSIYVCDENGYGENFTFTARLTWFKSDYIPTLTSVKVTASHDNYMHWAVRETAWDNLMTAIGEHANKLLK